MIADVRKAISTFVAHRQSNDGVLIDALAADGRTRAQAEALAVFVPIAFGRVLLKETGVTCPGIYRLRTASGLVPRRFMTHPVFAAATAVAKTGIDQETLLAVAGRSAEFKAANNALNDGSRPENLLLAEPILLLSSAEAAPPADADSVVTSPADVSAPGPSAPAPTTAQPPTAPARRGWLARLLGG